MRYWIFQGTDIKGPFSPGEIEASGGVAPEALVCEETRSGASELDWKPAAEIGDLGAALSPSSASEPILASSPGEAPVSQVAGLGPYAEAAAIPGAWPGGEIGWGEGAAESIESLVFLEFGAEELLFGGSGFGFFSWADLPSVASPAAAAPSQPSPAVVAPPPPQAPAEPPAPIPPRAEDDGPAGPPLHLGPAKTLKLLEEPESGPQSSVDASPPPTDPEAGPMPEPRLDEEAAAMAPAPTSAAPETAPLSPPVPDLAALPPGEAAAPAGGLEAPAADAALEGPVAEAVEPAAGATGLAASLEPAFFSAQQEAPLPAGEIGGGGELKPLEAPAPAADAPALPQADAVAGSPAAAPAASDSPPSLSVGPSTQEVIARLAKPQTMSSKAKAPAPRKKTNQRLLFGVLATLVVLAASWYLFWQNSGPREEAASASEAARRAPAPPPAPIARAPQEGITPQAAQGGSASPLPVSPYPAAQAAAPVAPAPVPSEQPAPAAPAAPDNTAQAIDLTKGYPLSGRRRSVGKWLSASFADKRGYKEEWSASPVGADGVESPFNYLVQYRVVSASGRVEPRLYLFEVDLSRRTVKGENRLARGLWAPRAEGASSRRARGASSGGRRHVRVERVIAIRPKAA